jgi:acetyl esterase
LVNDALRRSLGNAQNPAFGAAFVVRDRLGNAGMLRAPPTPMTLHLAIIARGFQLAAGWLMRPAPAYAAFAPDVALPIRVVVPTEAGSVTAYVYRPPAGSIDDGERPPVYLNIHGGGFIARHPEFDAHLCRVIAAEAGCVVVNVDYDVAPKRPYPVAPRQVYGVAGWVANAGAEAYGWDDSRIAIGGQSAGGNLAASACLRARDEGGFAAALQVLVYPPLDLAEDPGKKRAHTAKPLITPQLARAFNHTYARDPVRRSEPLASPLHAPELFGLPPALIVTADFDLLRDEGERYAERLAAAGVPVTYYLAQGVDHAFTHAEPIEPTRAMLDIVVDHLSKAWARPS